MKSNIISNMALSSRLSFENQNKQLQYGLLSTNESMVHLFHIHTAFKERFDELDEFRYLLRPK